MSKDASPEILADVDTILRELGRLVFNFNSAEHQLRRIAFLLIDRENERAGEITVDRLGANGLEELVAALSAFRLATSPDLVAQVSEHVKKFGDVRIRRNRLVHAVWVMPNESSTFADAEAVKMSFRAGERTTVAGRDAEPIRQIATDASVMCGDLESLYAKLRTAMTNRAPSA